MSGSNPAQRKVLSWKSAPNCNAPPIFIWKAQTSIAAGFKSSLLVGCGTRGNAPFKNVLTHGFILNEDGYKMSKSAGIALSPMQLMDQYGADILRLWVASADYTEDTKFGANIMKAQSDVYRRIRSTFCYLLGNLGGYTPDQAVPYEQLSELDRYVLHRLREIDDTVRTCIADFEFQKLITTLYNFCGKIYPAFIWIFVKTHYIATPQKA